MVRVSVSVDIEAALQASYESAVKYAAATGFPHAKALAEEATKRLGQRRKI